MSLTYRRNITLVLLIALASIPAIAGQVPPASALVQPAESDFDGDGFSDLAVGVPGEDFGDVNSVGAVNVVYGSPDGLVGEDNQFFYQGSPDIADDPEANDRFGSSLATGDFNADGFDDLAVGVPGDTISGEAGAGLVHVIYGSSSGLQGAGSQLLNQNTDDGTEIKDKAEFSDNFGDSLAAGNFGKGAADDLAVGVEQEDVGDKDDSGAVHILYGSGTGIRTAGNQFWSQNSKMGGVAIKDRAETEDTMGSSLGTGNFGYSDHDDLAIGIEYENVSGKRAGAVAVLYGSPDGISARHNQFWHQDSSQGGVAIKDSVDGSDTFGDAVAGGDFGKSTKDDLAIGVPDEKIGGEFVGGINVLYGSDKGLKAKGNQFWHQDSPGMVGTNGNDAWGAEVAAGDMGKNGRDDLAVGNFREVVNGANFAGSVTVIYATAKGLRAADSQLWTQETPDLDGTAELTDFFGTELVVNDFGRAAASEGSEDLAIAASGEDINDISGAGAVHVLYSNGNRLTVTNDQLIHQDQTLVGVEIVNSAEAGDSFGSSLDP